MHSSQARKSGLDFLFKKVRVFKVNRCDLK